MWAALLFAVDDSHGWTVGWLANRNAVLGALFGLAALSRYVRNSRKKSRLWGIDTAVLLLAAYLSSESAAAIPGAIAAYELFLMDRSQKNPVSGFRRWGLSLVVSLGWLGWYIHHRYGIIHSSTYLNIAHYPLLFLEELPIRFMMIWNSLFLNYAPSNIWLFLPGRSGFILTLVSFCVSVIVIFTVKIRGEFRRLAAFLLSSMVFSMFIVSMGIVQERSFTIASFFSSGILTIGLHELLRREYQNRLGKKILGYLLIFLHVIMAALMLPVKSLSPVIMRNAAGIHVPDAVSEADASPEKIIIVHAPFCLTGMYLPFALDLDPEFDTIPTMVLSSGIQPCHVTRMSENALQIECEGGFFNLFSAGIFLSPETHFQAGERIEFSDVDIIIDSIGENGRPEKVTFILERMRAPDYYLFLRYVGGRFVKYKLPDTGKTDTLHGDILESLFKGNS